MTEAFVRVMPLAVSLLTAATPGAYRGDAARAVLHGDSFWFAWAAFRSDTEIRR